MAIATDRHHQNINIEAHNAVPQPYDRIILHRPKMIHPSSIE